jgi:hypothetical protein
LVDFDAFDPGSKVELRITELQQAEWFKLSESKKAAG